MAARFWVNGGVDNNWGTASNWSTTSGGGGGAAVPTSSDAVTFDTNGNVPCTVNASSRVCASLSIGNAYSSTFTMSQQLSVSGSISIGTAVTMAGSSLLRQIAAGTWTTNGRTLPWALEIGGTTTFTSTLAGTLTTSSSLALTNTTSTIFSGAFAIVAASATISGTQTISLVNDFTINGLTTISDDCVINGGFKAWQTRGLTTTGNLSGSAVLRFGGGSGTWTGAAGTLSMDCNINTSGTLTLSGTILYNTSTLTYTAGTISAGSSTLTLGTCTLATSGMTWANITITGGVIVTMSSDVNVSGTTTSTSGSNALAGSKIWNTSTLTATSAVISNSGTPIIVLTGGGTWSGAGQIGTSLTFAGNSTISGSVLFGGSAPTLLWTSGTITVTGSTVSVTNNTAVLNLSSSSCPLNNLTLTNGTVTLNSNLTVNTTLTAIAIGCIFAGSFGWTTSTFVMSGSVPGVTLQSTVTYTVTSSFTATTGTSALHGSIIASTASSAALLNLSSAATQDLSFIDATDIDSSGGQPIYSYKATLTRTVNWKTQFGPVTTATFFVG